jgi:hypothetical protein
MDKSSVDSLGEWVTYLSSESACWNEEDYYGFTLRQTGDQIDLSETPIVQQRRRRSGTLG